MGNINFTHGGNFYEAKKICGKDLIDFSANINPLNMPRSLKNKIFDNFEEILNYPDPDSSKITRKIADFWKIKENNILIGNGSAELIYLLANVYKPRTAIIPVPTFSEYERALKLHKTDISFLRLKEKNQFCLKVSKNLADPDIFFICNPNNPTGNLLIKNRQCWGIRPKRFLVMDEAFMDFVSDQNKHTFVREAVKNKKIIVLRSFTKFFAVPGLRIGYLVAHQDIVKKLKQYQLPWNVNSFAQIAGELVLGDKEYAVKTYEVIEKEKSFLLKELSKFKGLKCFPAEANFILIKIKNRYSSEKLRTILVKKGVLIRSCKNFRGLKGEYIRIAVRGRRENFKLINKLKEVI
ncbi:MAG: threonine-phosphate decarboxylase CobD [Candidatus Omnitrophota bacterium]|nr:threonine-phosphate decarboxylase CobD [Candidatus Omnitrophota bacterium]MBU1894820.1 threonine-phosphate decarboxylase CobD [Candidatus Omnitrophota bacterium]